MNLVSKKEITIETIRNKPLMGKAVAKKKTPKLKLTWNRISA